MGITVYFVNTHRLQRGALAERRVRFDNLNRIGNRDMDQTLAGLERISLHDGYRLAVVRFGDRYARQRADIRSLRYGISTVFQKLIFEHVVDPVRVDFRILSNFPSVYRIAVSIR